MVSKDWFGKNSASYFTSHPRSFEDFRYVYPVVSRRAGGISVGVNLHPDKTCNFHCIYCQVERKDFPSVAPGGSSSALFSEGFEEAQVAGASLRDRQHIQNFIGLEQLEAELSSVLQMWRSGQLLTIRPFCDLPASLRRLNDIALSGDGEPTAYRNFPEIVSLCAEVRRRYGQEDLKLVLITNASLFHQPHVQQGLALLDQSGGEIWAKLDAGTESYFRQVARTRVPFERILRNIHQAAQQRPLVIQSLFMRIAGAGPSPEEQSAYCQRLKEILEAGGRIKLVQIYTIARPPAEPIVTPLPLEELHTLADQVRQITGLPVAVFPAPDSFPTDSPPPGAP